MKLQIFDAGSGDGMLLESKGGTRILIDGGKNIRNWEENLEQPLADLHANGHTIDAIYVSHIDSDHIGGVLRLLSNLADWHVFEAHDGDGVTAPESQRPPDVGEIWHNAFRDLITRNRGRIEELLAATAPDLLASSIPEVMTAGQEMADIATSIPEALRVSQLVRLKPLDIELNEPAGGKLMMVEETAAFDRGDLHFEVVGPTDKNLRDLRKGWDNWLRDDENRAKTKAIREELRQRLEEFAAGVERDDPLNLSSWNGVPSMEGVTVPNTASLMFLVTEDGGPSLLFTGDSHHDLILDNLRAQKKVDAATQAIHVDVLKVPHHGSEKNADKNFVRHVTADHYVFCGNGGHSNPDPSVIDLYYRSRRGSAGQRAVTAETQDLQRPFTFWFSTTSTNVSGEVSRKEFKKLEQRVERLVAKKEGLTAEFPVDGGHLELAL